MKLKITSVLIFNLFLNHLKSSVKIKMKVNLQHFNLLVVLIYELYNTLFMVFIIRNLQIYFFYVIL